MKVKVLCMLVLLSLSSQHAALRLTGQVQAPEGSVVPKELLEKYQSDMQKQLERLTLAVSPSYVPPDMGIFDAISKKGKTSAPNNRFEAVKVELPLPVPLIEHIPVELGAPETGNLGGKNLVGKDQLKKQTNCVVYALGIAGNSKFEEAMATSIGCEVHAFDCTIDSSYASVTGKHFHFHEWCIGKDKSTDGKDINMTGLDGNYLKGANQNKKLMFKTLLSSMQELGHSTMDLLKFDIEGFEWQLFEDELLTGDVLPRQIMFEMHTEGAKPWAVPKDNTQGRTNNDVNKVFLKLHQLGYRVVSKELNRKDRACAEFVMVLV